MNVRERYVAAYNHEPVDRVPIAVSYFHAGFARRNFQDGSKGANPMDASMERQSRYGFDPCQYLRGAGSDWFLPQPGPGVETPDDGAWRVTQEVTEETEGLIRTDYTIDTAHGQLTCLRRQTPDDFGLIVEPFIKEEGDMELLRHRPHPRYLVDPGLIRSDFDAVGDRGWAKISLPGVWTQASFFRGPENIMFDCYDRPDWVKRFLALLAEYQAEMVRAIGKAEVGATLRVDSSFLGFGLSRDMFMEFIQPHEERIVQAGHEAGLRVHLHICGKKNAFLEDLADMGLDALETLTPGSAAGDVELADVKRRIGDRVCLMGGFLSHILTTGTPQEIEEEVRVCIDKAAAHSGYILSPSGRIDPETPEENLVAFTDAGRRYGAAA